MSLKIASGARAFCAVAFISAALGFGAVAQTSPPAQSSSKSQAAAAAPAIPSSDQILDKYVEACGGRAAWLKLKSRVSKGTVDLSANTSGTIDIQEKAPNRMLATVTISGSVFIRGFDGTVGWSNDPKNGLRELTGDELAETRRDSDFYHPLDIRKIYSKLNVVGTEKVGSQTAYVLEATPVDGRDPDKIYFDVDSGLLVRAVTQEHTPEGFETAQEDFEDYRTVDGIKIAFTIHQKISNPQDNSETEFTIKFDEVHHNVDLPDSEFSKPTTQ